MSQFRPRYLEQIIRDDLRSGKMVFLGGPRQVGKTTLSLHLLGPDARSDSIHPAYLNWDAPGVARELLNGVLPARQKLIILDEIHKYPKWRNLIKGLYDTHRSKINFLVTGSSRLDQFRKGGDSLQGRYFFCRLGPFTLPELKGESDALETLLKFGGFPEPLFSASDTFWRRWQRAHLSRVVREDVRDLERVDDIGQMEILAESLPGRVGSPLSIQQVAGDVQKDPKTIVRWLKILESLFLCFRIPPFGAPKIRAVKKEQKLYMWDWSLVQDPGKRFENFVAVHLQKFCNFIEDTEGYACELRFLRDTDGREVDFVVLKDRKPWFGVEVKLSAQAPAKSIRYFRERSGLKKFYQVHLGTRLVEQDGVSILPFAEFCREIGLV